MSLNLNRLLDMESELIDLLSNSPLMPPTLLVRAFDTDIEEVGKVFSTDNLILKISGVQASSLEKTTDDSYQTWDVDFEVMVITRDFRGHHAVFPLLETINYLLVGYHTISSSKPISLQNINYEQYNENSFRYWSLKFSTSIYCFQTWYRDIFEPVPKNTRCLEQSCDNLWTGVNQDSDYNICWRRYQVPGENKFRFYNSCSQSPGDEITNTFNDKPYGDGGLYESLPWMKDRGVTINFALYRNEAGDVGNKDPKGKVVDISVASGWNIISKMTPIKCFHC